jgi:transcriptional regulator with XRE-family HTH domain
MATREDPVDRGARRARNSIRRMTAELRDTRISAGLSQQEVGAAVGISRSPLSRIETQSLPDLSIGLAGRIAGAVGLDLSIRLYPGPNRLRDVAQVGAMDRMCCRLGPDWRWVMEVVLALVGDQRAWDAVGTHSGTGLRVWVEVESRVSVAQALLRRLALKRRDGDARRLILVINDTRLNREAVRAAGSSIRASFPADARRARALLSEGKDPGADVLILL